MLKLHLNQRSPILSSPILFILTGWELFKRLDINENEVVLFAVNAKVRDLDEKLESGDHIAIFPPIDGG